MRYRTVMLRRVVARHVLALCAALAALSAPATAVLHGLEHEHEAAALASHMVATGNRDTHARPAIAAVEAADAEETHPALHAGLAVQIPKQFATAMPAAQSPDVATPLRESNARVPSFAIIVHASPHGDPGAQPRAPPLV